MLQTQEGATVSSEVALSILHNITSDQGFMQDQIIASHTCFGGHMDVNC